MQQNGCRIHQQKNIIGICISKSCKNKRSCCFKCLKEFHKDHPTEVLEQDEVQQLIENNQKTLEQVLYQIKELESVLQVIKLSFESLIQNTTINLDNTQLIDQVEILLKTDDRQQKQCTDAFLNTMKQIGRYAECIFNFKMDGFKIKENIEKFIQVNQLLNKEGYRKSMQIIENMLTTQNQDPSSQSMKIQSLITVVFQSQEMIQEGRFIGQLNDNINSIQLQIPQFKILTYQFFQTIQQKVEQGSQKYIQLLNLIYLGSRDGLNANAYWSKVNGKRNLLIIMISQIHQVFGGYSPYQWEYCGGKWIQDDTQTSFLFQQTKNQIFWTMFWQWL